MKDEKLRQPVNRMHLLYAMAPIAMLVFLAVTLIHGFSKIGDRPAPAPSTVPAPKAAALPGRAPGPPAVPPARCLSWSGGYAAVRERLRPLHRAPEVSRPGKRLVADADLGQTFELWRASAPAEARGARRTIYVQPIGAFTPAEERVVALTAELLGVYFGLPVTRLAPLPVDAAWPKEARRADKSWGPDQLKVPYVLEKLLAPRIAGDAVVVLGLTAHGLWEGDDLTFSYGRTSPSERVAIWSLAPNGELGRDPEAQEEHVRRTFKTAVHEIGHVLSIEHCTAYVCAMRGAEDMAGVDLRPLWLCPECEAKLLAATGVDPLWHYERLVGFFRELGMGEEAWFYERALFAVRGVPGLEPPFVAGVTRVVDSPVCAPAGVSPAGSRAGRGR
ncbi:MAG: archaemetzincin [Proteobacteria bacterium]|jgi:archaemetzincin|nr:archaemetzincin [Pseudomonadota bacterium]